MNRKYQINLLNQIYYIDKQINLLVVLIRKLPNYILVTKARYYGLKNQLNLLQKKTYGINIEKRKLEIKLLEYNGLLNIWQSRLYQEKSNEDLVFEIQNKKQRALDIEKKIFDLQHIIGQSASQNSTFQKQLTYTKKILIEKYDKIQLILSRSKSTKNKWTSIKNIILGKMEVEIFLKYKKIFERKNGEACSYISNETCQSCMRFIRPEILQRIEFNLSIENCSACNKFLLVNQFIK